jgi:hypothetical protein
MAAKRKKARKKIAHTRTVTVKVKRKVTTYTYDAECEWCGEPFEARRSTARFCSDRCRMGAHRDEKRREGG